MTENFRDDDLPEPTRCYVSGCSAPNELMLHLRTDPAGYADLCLPHARIAAIASDVTMTCICMICARTRRRFDLQAQV